MARNNVCVIYDSDENYAKRLMSIINEVPISITIYSVPSSIPSTRKSFTSPAPTAPIICKNIIPPKPANAPNKYRFTLFPARTLINRNTHPVIIPATISLLGILYDLRSSIAAHIIRTNADKTDTISRLSTSFEK